MNKEAKKCPVLFSPASRKYLKIDLPLQKQSILWLVFIFISHSANGAVFIATFFNHSE